MNAPADDPHPLVFLELTADQWRRHVGSVQRTRIVKAVGGGVHPGPDDADVATIRLGPVPRWGVIYSLLYKLTVECGVLPREVLADGGEWA